MTAPSPTVDTPSPTVDPKAAAEAALCAELPTNTKIGNAFTRFGQNPTSYNGGQVIGLLTVEETALGKVARKFDQAGDGERARKIRRLIQGMDTIRRIVIAYPTPTGLTVPNLTSELSNAFLGVTCK
jgi:hypothetical protein